MSFGIIRGRPSTNLELGPSQAVGNDGRMRQPILLGGYAAKQCPVRIQNDYLPLVPRLKWVPSPEDQARLDAGNAFEADVFDKLVAIHPSAVVVGSQLSNADAILMTVQAMDAGASLILGGRLPDDVDGGRTGRPDILVKSHHRYLPADVKNHLTLKRSKVTSAVVSLLESPDERVDVPGWTAATTHRYEDGLQLAHYSRMLEACGHHPGPTQRWGAVLGTSRLESRPGQDPQWVLVWHNLDEQLGFTYSRSRGKVRRSLLERYDHEHRFRLTVADNARRIIGRNEDPQPLVEPVGQDECAKCPYERACAQQMGNDDPSAAIRIGGLGTREWLALRRLGVDTTAALSALDPDDPVFFATYFADVSNLSRTEARKRLRGAIDRAEMICQGFEIARTGDGPAKVPVADVEIDVDIEWDIDNRVYMWGARLRRVGDETTARYVTDFVSWEQLDSTGERNLAARFLAWLRVQRDAACAEGLTLKVFHWSHPERSKLISILGLAEVGDLVDPETGVFMDLEKAFNSNFMSLHGSSMKKVAPNFGFAWRVDDPGGAISQTYLSKARNSHDPAEREAARAWLLSYNEDDNAAMAAIRDGMISWTP